MTTIDIRTGTVTVTDETIQIDVSPFKGLKRIYEQSKTLVIFFISGFLFIIDMAIIDSGAYYRTLAKFTIIFTIVAPIVDIIYNRLRSSIKYASEISRTTIHRVEYTTGSRLFPPKIRIIVDDGVVTGVRPIPLSHRRLGGDQQLEDAIQAFEDNGIDIVPAPDDS